MELSLLSVLGTGILIMLAVGSIVILVHSYSGIETKRRLTSLEDGLAKLNKRMDILESKVDTIIEEIKKLKA